MSLSPQVLVFITHFFLLLLLPLLVKQTPFPGLSLSSPYSPFHFLPAFPIFFPSLSSFLPLSSTPSLTLNDLPFILTTARCRTLLFLSLFVPLFSFFLSLSLGLHLSIHQCIHLFTYLLFTNLMSLHPSYDVFHSLYLCSSRTPSLY